VCDSAFTRAVALARVLTGALTAGVVYVVTGLAVAAALVCSAAIGVAVLAARNGT
jgi:hypothetical protein